MVVAAETLIEEIKNDFCHYLRQGFRPDSLVAELPQLNIEDVETLLNVHFLMTDSVQKFVERLPERLRRIKTSTEKRRESLRGQVRGQIRWGPTLTRRCRSGYRDPSVFVCEQIEKNYNIAENLVLKRLLFELHDIVTANADILAQHPQWLAEWFGAEQLRKKLDQGWLKNVHVKQIDLMENYEITDRMIRATCNSRKTIYKEAANLLLQHQRIMNYILSPNEARDLLSKTIVQPEQGELLFELYWIIKIIKTFEAAADEKIEFKIIGPNQSMLAEWVMNGSTYRIYHNTVEPFRFFVSLEEEGDEWREAAPDSFFHRSGKIREKFDELSERLFDKRPGDSLWGGRPDIILTSTKLGSERPSQVFIGEAKYTESSDYARQGLRELIEYMAFIQDESGQKAYVDQRDGANSDAVLNSPRVQGFLLTDHIDYSQKSSDSIQIFSYGEDGFGARMRDFVRYKL